MNMNQNKTCNQWLLKTLLGLTTLAAFITMVLGIYHHDWYALFGLVMLTASAFCNVVAYLSPNNCVEKGDP